MPPNFSLVLERTVQAISALQARIAQTCRWLTLGMVIATSAIIILRFFDIGSVAIQDSVTYMHATLFMLTLAYTAQEGGHVRVDVFYRKLSIVNQAWVNLFGAIFFLLPFAVFVAFISWHAAAQSWAIQEGSINPGGLPFVYLLKTLPPLSGVLLSLYALSELAKQLLFVSVKQEELEQ